MRLQQRLPKAFHLSNDKTGLQQKLLRMSLYYPKFRKNHCYYQKYNHPQTQHSFIAEGMDYTAIAAILPQKASQRDMSPNQSPTMKRRLAYPPKP